jgi:hypothetical protein
MLDDLGQCFAEYKVNTDGWPCRHFIPVKKFLCSSKGIEVDYNRCEGCFKALSGLDGDCSQYRLAVRKVIDFMNRPKPKKVELKSVVRFRRVK